MLKISNSSITSTKSLTTAKKDNKNKSSFPTIISKKSLISKPTVSEAVQKAIEYQSNVELKYYGASVSISYEAAHKYKKYIDDKNTKPLVTLKDVEEAYKNFNAKIEANKLTTEEMMRMRKKLI